MEDDFYASIKLITGEEVFARVLPCIDENNFTLLLNNPVTIVEVSTRSGNTGYKIEPWLKTTSEDVFVLSMERVLTMTENKETEIIEMHQSFVKKFNNVKNKKPNVSRKMGYIANTNEAKNLLERIYKNF